MAKLHVRVQPGAKSSQLLSLQDGVWRIKLSARPIEGKANEALIELLARLLDVPKRRLSIVVGKTVRDKVLDVEGLTGEEIEIRLARNC